MTSKRIRKHPSRRKGDQNKSLQLRSLLLLNGYRFSIATLIFSFNFFDTAIIKQDQNSNLFLYLSTFYIIYAAIAWLVSTKRIVDLNAQVHINILIDVLTITYFTLIAGGVSSGWGTLIIAPIAGAALLLPGRTALLFAAYGTVALISQEIYGDLTNIIVNTAYSQAGLLGIALFATAFLAITLAKRASESAALAEKRGIDLANLAQLNEHLINRIESGIIVVDDDKTIKLMNRAAIELLGLEKSTKQLSLTQASDGLLNIYETWTSNKQRPGYEAGEFTLDSKNQPAVRVRITRVGARLEDRGSVIYLTDTSDLNKQVQETKLASLGRLTASIAHEIRNPLGAISHAAQLLEETTDLPPDSKKLANIIHIQSNRLNEVIQNVLRLSRKDSASLDTIELKHWLIEFVQEFSNVHKLPNNWINAHVTPESLMVLFDTNHLHQVLWNVCTNALNYASSGQSSPCVTLNGHVDNNSDTKFLDIIDSGPGVNTLDQDKLFEPFFTTSNSGTGLGLYISRELCLSNGGDLSYLSLPEGGSCFRIRFPRNKQIQ